MRTSRLQPCAVYACAFLLLYARDAGSYRTHALSTQRARSSARAPSASSIQSPSSPTVASIVPQVNIARTAPPSSAWPR
eukprot:569887-Alexandrium_andersonii.AAC.1